MKPVRAGFCTITELANGIVTLEDLANWHEMETAMAWGEARAQWRAERAAKSK